MTVAYRELTRDWGPSPPYQGMFERGWSNAHLVPFAAYYRWTGAFTRLLRQHGDDLNAFYLAVEELAALEPEERNQRLMALADAAQADPEPKDTVRSRGRVPS